MGRAKPSDEETQDAHAAALKLAISITHSKQKARDVVQDAYEKVLTTRHWDEGRVAFEQHLCGVVRSLLSHEYHAAARRHERAVTEAFQDEVVGRRQESIEEQLVKHEAVLEREAAEASILERLKVSIAHHGVAPGVLRCHSEGIYKSAAIAQALGVSVDSVYRAQEVLQYHLRRIKEDDDGGA